MQKPNITEHMPLEYGADTCNWRRKRKLITIISGATTSHKTAIFWVVAVNPQISPNYYYFLEDSDHAVHHQIPKYTCPHLLSVLPNIFPHVLSPPLRILVPCSHTLCDISLSQHAVHFPSRNPNIDYLKKQCKELQNGEPVMQAVSTESTVHRLAK
jgi:hypothetical protein